MSQEKTVVALQERIGELEAALREAITAHDADRQAIKSLQERADQQARSLREAQEACERERASLHEQEEAYQEHVRATDQMLLDRETQQAERLEKEASAARAALEEELAQARARADEEVLALVEGTREEMVQERAQVREETLVRLRAFSDNYNYYLSQLKLMMDLLTKAALNTGAAFLTTAEADTGRLFRAGFASDAAGTDDADDAERTEAC